jgi:hypothetical protein
VSSCTRMADKMPVVSGMGEEFQWTNLMFAPGNMLLNCC